jgi:hypothetical protein
MIDYLLSEYDIFKYIVRTVPHSFGDHQINNNILKRLYMKYGFVEDNIFVELFKRITITGQSYENNLLIKMKL